MVNSVDVCVCTKQGVELEARLEDTEREEEKNSSPRVTGVSR